MSDHKEIDSLLNRFGSVKIHNLLGLLESLDTDDELQLLKATLRFLRLYYFHSPSSIWFQGQRDLEFEYFDFAQKSLGRLSTKTMNALVITRGNEVKDIIERKFKILSLGRVAKSESVSSRAMQPGTSLDNKDQFEFMETIVKILKELPENAFVEFIWLFSHGQLSNSDYHGLKSNIGLLRRFFLENLMDLREFYKSREGNRIIDHKEVDYLFNEAQMAMTNLACQFFNLMTFHGGDQLFYELRKIEKIVMGIKGMSFSSEREISNSSTEDDSAMISRRPQLFAAVVRGRLIEVLKSFSQSDIAAENTEIQIIAQKLEEVSSFLVDIFVEEELDRKNSKDLLTQIAAITTEMRFLIHRVDPKDTSDIIADQIDFAVSNLGKKLKSFQAKLYKLIVRKSWLPHFHDELGFVNMLLVRLLEMINCHIDKHIRKNEIETIHAELQFLSTFFNKNLEKPPHVHKSIDNLHKQTIQVAWETEYLLDSILLNDGRAKYLSSFLSCVREKLTLIKIGVMGVLEKVPLIVASPKLVTHQARTQAVADVIVGFDTETELMVRELVTGSKELDIIAIFGMPGLGKTTLANKLYNHKTVINHFHSRAWCCVSQQYERDNLLNVIYEQFVLHKKRDNEIDTAEELQRYLKVQRCLIVLDDVWTTDAWDDLIINFPIEGDGSRIILTSRLEEVAKYARRNSNPHHLPFLTKEESWELLCRKLFDGKMYLEDDLVEVGKLISEKCGGLPHSVVLISGLLAKMEKKASSWTEVLNSLNSLIQTENQSQGIVEFSYKHLPDYLKPCFLYIGILFEEEREIQVSKLVQLWIAKGFVHTTEGKNLEDLAQDQLKDLVSSSLVIVGKRRYNGDISTCSIHDLVHEFCVRKAREENLLLLVRKHGNLDAITRINQRWLYLHSEAMKKLDLETLVPADGRIRSLRCSFGVENRPHFVNRVSANVTWIPRKMKLLKVLDLGYVFTGSRLLSTLKLLVHLQYLAVYHGISSSVPQEIGGLQNLRTLIFRSYGLYFPTCILNLVKLRHLVMPWCRFGLNDEDGESSTSEASSVLLDELQTFSKPYIRCTKKDENMMRRFPNLRSLDCIVDQSYDPEANTYLFPRLEYLSNLEYLHMSPMVYAAKYPSKFNFPQNLKELKLGDFRLPWSEISQVACLQNLEGLELYRAFEGAAWDVVDTFQRLKLLKLNSALLEQWNASDGSFPQLEQLVLEGCEMLNAVPASFADVDTLVNIEVNRCKHSVVKSVMRIQEQVQEMGYYGLNVTITH